MWLPDDHNTQTGLSAADLKKCVKKPKTKRAYFGIMRRFYDWIKDNDDENEEIRLQKIGQRTKLNFETVVFEHQDRTKQTIERIHNLEDLTEQCMSKHIADYRMKPKTLHNVPRTQLFVGQKMTALSEFIEAAEVGQIVWIKEKKATCNYLRARIDRISRVENTTDEEAEEQFDIVIDPQKPGKSTLKSFSYAFADMYNGRNVPYTSKMITEIAKTIRGSVNVITQEVKKGLRELKKGSDTFTFQAFFQMASVFMSLSFADSPEKWCFFILAFMLAGRSNNIGGITFAHIKWSDDHLGISFAGGTKMDQNDEKAGGHYKRYRFLARHTSLNCLTTISCN